MAHITEEIECCGIKELANISGSKPEQILEDIGGEWFGDTPRAYLIFSCRAGEKAGHRLATYIKQNGLGKVARTKSRTNPNSGNLLSAWLWSVNNTTYKAWLNKNHPDWQTEWEDSQDSDW